MSVVSNASPLINLARIGKLNLIRELYGQLIVPEAIWDEVVIAGAGQPGADEVKAATWIKTRAITNKQLVQALQQELDVGEAEAIVLALEARAELLLMDEHLGREVAHHWKCAAQAWSVSSSQPSAEGSFRRSSPTWMHCGT